MIGGGSSKTQKVLNYINGYPFGNMDYNVFWERIH